MNQSHHVVPTLADITRNVTQIHAAMQVREVIEIFQKDPSLLSLPVCDEGRFAGSINRRVLFFEHLGRPFAMDLYAKKAIRELLAETQVSLEPELDINSALSQLLRTDPGLSMDSFPVVCDGTCHGIVTVSDLMMTISDSQAMLLQTLKQLGARIAEEVERASKIQRDLLPPPESVVGEITIAAEVVTSSEIGGDFYDYFTLGDGRLGLVIADVSGHGVQAGMVTTAAKASLHSLIGLGGATPAELLYGMNNAILATARQSLLMTCLVAIVDTCRGRIVMANAGHNFPYLIRQGIGEAEMLQDASGYPLGFEANCRYGETEYPFSPGDTLFLYSDGIVECTDPDGEEFGYDRLQGLLVDGRGLQPAELRDLLRRSAEWFASSTTFEDDVTLLVAGWSIDR